jgi:hypothetical protein
LVKTIFIYFLPQNQKIFFALFNIEKSYTFYTNYTRGRQDAKKSIFKTTPKLHQTTPETTPKLHQNSSQNYIKKEIKRRQINVYSVCKKRYGF